MDLLTGSVENRLIKNCAAMMFCEKPEKFFPITRVDIVLFPEGSINNPDVMIEVPPIMGPVPKMISETLSYIRTNVIKKKILKPLDSEKSITITNYPYQAFEEAVVNALYHRNYQEREPVEITIEPTHVDILSYSGPDCSISLESIKEARRLKARRYRNRRLGDFLKELELTEGRATGIPTIQKSLKLNGSAPATIETDDNRTYFLLTIPCREGFEQTDDELVTGRIEDVENKLLQIFGNGFVKVQNVVNENFTQDKTLLLQLLLQMTVNVWNKVKEQSALELLAISTIEILVALKRNNSSNITDLQKSIEIEKTYEFRRKILNPLIEMGFVSMTIPNKPRSSKQKYILSAKGVSLF
ncbi:MAG: Fic family protein [Candidatus Limisoma sp.]